MEDQQQPNASDKDVTEFKQSSEQIIKQLEDIAQKGTTDPNFEYTDANHNELIASIDSYIKKLEKVYSDMTGLEHNQDASQDEESNDA